MAKKGSRRRTVIMGAAGRDFHNFNMVFRDDARAQVVAFTAAQIPGIGGRRYPPELAGPLYPGGIPIVEEAELEAVCREQGVDQVVFAYSDVSFAQVMAQASRALATGADFVLLGPARTMLESRRPVIAVTAVRTGCGKSQTARHVSRLVRERGLRAAVLRHPMPYGELAREAVQRFASAADLDQAACTLEEREEYEPHVAAGNVVFAGVDYARILEAAEAEADVVLWDGGNNDFSFVRPDLHVVVADALRPDDVDTYYPGAAVLRTADVVVVNKIDAARPGDADRVAATAARAAPAATIVRAASPVALDDQGQVRGRRALVVEDGPTVTHGGMAFGAGLVAARAAGAAEIVDPRPFAAPEIAAALARYPHLGPVLPALGYGPTQLKALKRTIEASDADVVVAATPIDLARAVETSKPVVRARYDYADAGAPTLGSLVGAFLARIAPAKRRG